MLAEAVDLSDNAEPPLIANHLHSMISNAIFSYTVQDRIDAAGLVIGERLGFP